LLIPYLGYMLKGNASDGALFMSRLTNNSNITYVRTCNTMINGEIFNHGFIYPNPVLEQLNVYLPENSNQVKYAIMDVLGHELIKGEINNTMESIQVANLPKGVYFIRLFNSFEQTNIKFIKE